MMNKIKQLYADWYPVIYMLIALVGAMYSYLSFKQAALERQGVQMSKWDILLLQPQVRVVEGKTTIGD